MLKQKKYFVFKNNVFLLLTLLGHQNFSFGTLISLLVIILNLLFVVAWKSVFP